MPAALLGILRGFGASALAGIKANPAAFLVRVFRGMYAASLGSIGVFWYTGWRRQRVEKGSGKFPIPGATKLKAKFPASLKDAPPPEAVQGVTPTGKGVSNPIGDPSKNPAITFGTNANGKHENFDPIRYTRRLHTAQVIARQFHLKLTGGYRTKEHNAAVNGVPDSLHIDGLGFDFVGASSDMARAMQWAKNQPKVFSEVLIHDAGSGIHLHLGFWPGAGL